MRTSYLVCYDICDDKRLSKVLQTMCGYGGHLQYSVFECQLTVSDLARCRAELAAIIHHREDQVLFVNPHLYLYRRRSKSGVCSEGESPGARDRSQCQPTSHFFGSAQIFPPNQVGPLSRVG